MEAAVAELLLSLLVCDVGSAFHFNKAGFVAACCLNPDKEPSS